MQRLPIKSTERGSDPVVYKKREVLDVPPVNTKAKLILKIVLIIFSVVAGTAVCTTVVYFAFLKKGDDSTSEDDNKKETESSGKYIQSLEKNRISYKCTDIVANCVECKEITGLRDLAANAGANDALTTIVCTSCDTGYYPIYNEEGTIIFCNKICETGSEELCKTCHTENQNQCGSCNNGHYMPSDDFSKSKCQKCSELIEHCEACYGSKHSIICTSCNSNYFLSREKNICEPLCVTGTNNYCKTCSPETNQCSTCNSGYYLPSDEENKSKCKKCSDINDKCQECIGTKDKVTCLSCKSGYIPLYNEKNEIIDCNMPCETGAGEYCKTCNTQLNQCSSCNNGYYLPNDDLYKLKCKKCSNIVTNCNECHGELYKVTCDSFEGTANCEGKTKCQTGPNEKCLECDYDKDQCKSCNKGYYLPSDDHYKLECRYCGYLIENCEECSGTMFNVVCSKCKSGYVLEYDEESKTKICKAEVIPPNPPAGGCVTGSGDKCLTCHETENICGTCNTGYLLVDGKCIVNYSMRGTYISEYPYEKVKLVHNLVSSNIKKLIIDGEEIESPSNYYNFPEPKVHEVYFLFKMPNWVDFTNVYANCDKMLTAEFTPLFNLSNAKSFNSMFSGCYQLRYIDVSAFDTRSLETASRMFTNCYQLTSIDISMWNFTKVYDLSEMFSHCYKLTSVDFSKIRVPKLSNADGMFVHCHSLISIDFSNIRTLNLRFIAQLFDNCRSLKYLNVLNIYTDQVIKMSSVFRNCSSLTSLDLSTFSSPSVNTLDSMFEGCSSLTSIDLKQFVTNKVSVMTSVFKDCTNLKYINMGKSTYRYTSDIYKGVPNGGTIVVHPNMVENAEKYLKSREWNIITPE